MTPTSGPPWMRGPAGRRGYRTSAGDLRVSDAERTEVADRLSRHYADGRLDQAEFNERLEQAMSAKTQSDLGGLFFDLPPVDESGKTVSARPPRRSHPLVHYVLFALLLVVLVSLVIHLVFWPFHHGLLLIAVIVAVLLLRHDLRRRRHW
ncbi:MAG TPA: DUF1707 domain-containing protein [Mycobacteriales bacterium]|nr:DUF1707 domain-containing protein [Mycobacteriales bacterium]